MSGHFFGKFRGTVADNRDPQHLGRVRAKVPDVLGDRESGWALPCAPCVGDGTTGLAVPRIGDRVWIEFEQGDPDYPIWSGCWWDATDEAPIGPRDKILLKTAAGHAILIDDVPGTGGITVAAGSGERIRLTAHGIEIDNGKGARIELRGPQVSINGDALEVT